MSKRAVRVEIYQNLVNYKKPTSFQLKESYPLPPPSTIIGMVHFACGYEDYHKMDIGIQGSCHSKVNDLYSRYEFGTIKYDPERHNLALKCDSNIYGVTRGVATAELLVDVNLVIHIIPEDDNEIEKIYQAFKSPKEYISLGRREDIIRIDSVNIVSLDKKEISSNSKLENDAYIPIDSFDKEEATLFGTIYSLNKVYEKIKVKKEIDIRQWQKVNVIHASINESEFLEDAELYYDGEYKVYPI